MLTVSAYSGVRSGIIRRASPPPYRVTPNITYLTANNFEAKLDVYARSDVTTPQPTMIWIHGGGWTGGNKEGATFSLLPYMEMGWNVVNVEYRLAKVSLAPAAVEDCLCALRWVMRNAKQYNFDTSKLVVSGSSAGGHLALTTAMIPASEGLDRECPGNEELKVAAVVDWFGITDVADLLDGAEHEDLRGPVDGQHAEPRGDREARVAVDLRSCRVCRRSFQSRAIRTRPSRTPIRFACRTR